MKKFENLLKLIIEFANERKEEKIPDKFDKLCFECGGCGFFYQPLELYSDMNLDGRYDYAAINKARSAQKVLIKTATELLSEPQAIRYKPANYLTYWEIEERGKNESLLVMMYENENDLDNAALASILINLMFILGLKGLKVCPGCNHIFVLKSNRKQKTCSNKCRQREYQRNLPDKKKKNQRERRSEIYYQKKGKEDKQ